MSSKIREIGNRPEGTEIRRDAKTGETVVYVDEWVVFRIGDKTLMTANEILIDWGDYHAPRQIGSSG
jgi:hypothetical protein